MSKTKIKNFSEYLETVDSKWRSSMEDIYKVIQKSELSEKIKWGVPVFCLDNKNILAVLGFKNHMAIWFYQGVFLSDDLGVLSNAQEGKTKGMRHWKFSESEKIPLKAVKQYVDEAINNHKAGKVLETQVIKPSKNLEIPSILNDQLIKNEALSKAWKKFTFSKQKEFVEHLNSAKREQTKENRLEKIVPLILRGEGLNDKYK